MLIDMNKSLVKLTNILLALNESNEDNVTTIKKIIYNARYAYWKSEKGSTTEIEQ